MCGLSNLWLLFEPSADVCCTSDLFWQQTDTGFVSLQWLRLTVLKNTLSLSILTVAASLCCRTMIMLMMMMMMMMMMIMVMMDFVWVFLNKVPSVQFCNIWCSERAKLNERLLNPSLSHFLWQKERENERKRKKDECSNTTMTTKSPYPAQTGGNRCVLAWRLSSYWLLACRAVHRGSQLL